MIIGLTGYARAGKDTAAMILKEQGFDMFVFSDILAEMLKSQGKLVTKENMSILGVELRKKTGCEYILAKLLSDKIIDFNKNIVISGFRSPGEVDVFRTKFKDNFKLIYLDRGFKLRFKGRTEETQNEDDFIKRDLRDGKEMGLDRIIEERLFDIRIENNGDLEELKNNVFTAAGLIRDEKE
jgi:dephospho-CoA kinase